MKTMTSLLISLAFMLALAPAATYGLTVDLWAGGGDYPYSGADVGDVTISFDGTNILVDVVMAPGSFLINSHVDAALTVDGIPQTKKKNPIPGQFRYSIPATIPLEEIGESLEAGDHVAIAVHGIVASLASSGACTSCDACALATLLPETAGVFVDWPGADSYFDVDLIDAEILNGFHKGWCADPGTGIPDIIDPDPPLVANVYSSICEDLTAVPNLGIPLANLGNLPKVNWIVNQDWAAPTTVADIQAAIWYFLQGSFSGPGLQPSGDPWGTFDPAFPARAQAIVDAANAAEMADGPFVPGCDDVVLVILTNVQYYDAVTREPLPEPVVVQTILIEVENACANTAWGIDQSDVREFGGKNWAFWIDYEIGE